MASIQLYQYFCGTIDGEPIQGGSLSQARSVTLGDDEVNSQTFKIAAEGIVKVWDAVEDEAMGDFDLLWLESDLNVLVQYTADPGVTDVYVTQELKGSGTAGEMGVARVLNSDRMDKLDGTIDTFDGTEATIKEIWIKNPSTTDVARVRRVVAT
ncbi:MAG: hypothetical protein ACYSWO_29945 [Planctomycetota bacterium]|jgi:hypothetical protein